MTAQPIFNKEVIEVGDNVRLKGQVSAGTVMELQGKQAVVAFGMIKSTVKLEQLEKVSKGQIKREIQKSTFVSSQTTDNMHEKKINFKQEIDVRGMRGRQQNTVELGFGLGFEQITFRRSLGLLCCSTATGSSV